MQQFIGKGSASTRVVGKVDPARTDGPGHAAVLLRVLAISGYGLWMWLGLALALGLSRVGRNGTLIPVALGVLLVGAGLLLACLRVPGLASWHGWRPRPGHRPTRAALMALVTFLPVLAVAGLARGDNVFWATRLSGVALLLCALASLMLAVHDDRQRLSPALQRASALLPACHVATAGYAGGLWLWLCVLADGDLGQGRGLYLWVLLLLALALGLGLLESSLWQSLRAPGTAEHDVATAYDLHPRRFVAAALTYALPCAALLLGGAAGSLLAAALSAPACVLGRWLEQQSYGSALLATAAA